MKYLALILTLCSTILANPPAPVPTPFPTPVPMLQTSLQKDYYFDNKSYLNIDINITEPKNLTQMMIYIEDTNKCFAQADVTQKNPPNVTMWSVVLLPNQDAKLICELVFVFLYNGYVDKRLVQIYNAGNNE